MYPPDEVEAGVADEAAPETCDPVEEVPEVEFDELELEQKVDVLRNVLGDVLANMANLEGDVRVVQGILHRILEAAEKAEVKSRIEVPRMDIPRAQGSRGRRR